MPWQPIPPEEADRVLGEIPGHGQPESLSATETRRRIEAGMVKAGVEPEQMRRVLEEVFGPLD